MRPNLHSSLLLFLNVAPCELAGTGGVGREPPGGRKGVVQNVEAAYFGSLRQRSSFLQRMGYSLWRKTTLISQGKIGRMSDSRHSSGFIATPKKTCDPVAAYDGADFRDAEVD